MSCRTKGKFYPNYRVPCIEALLGLHEGWGRQGRRDVTILDLLSWARDPGGMHLHREAEEDWTWRRGPLAPHSDEAAILWDFFIAVKKLRQRGDLTVEEHAVLGLTLLGFTDGDIAQLVGQSRQRVSRVVGGRPRRDAQGHVVREPAICANCKIEDASLDRCGHGAVVYTGGIAAKITRAMNGQLSAEAV